MKKGAMIGLIVGGSVLLIFILLLVIGSGSNNNSNSVYNDSIAFDEQNQYVGETTTVIHKDFKAIMKEDWVENDTSSSGSSYVAYTPPGVVYGDANGEYIYVAVGNLGGETYTLDELLNLIVGMSNESLPNFELISSSDEEGKGIVGKEIKYTMSSNGNKLNLIEFFGIKYNTLYTVTYICPVGNCNYYPVYNVFVESFEPIEVEQ